MRVSEVGESAIQWVSEVKRMSQGEVSQVGKLNEIGERIQMSEVSAVKWV